MNELQEIWHFILKSMWFIAPAGFATVMPVLVRPVFSFLAYPIDFNAKLGNEPLFGKNKTWRGLIAGTATGVVTFWFQQALVALPWFASISIIDYGGSSLWFGFLMGFGAIIGDLIKSFFKRRFKIPPGVSWFPFDQIDYVLGAIIFLAPLYFPGLRFTLGLLVVGICLHLISNVLGHLMKLRKDWI